MAESYLPLAEESGRRSGGIVQHLITMLVGFGLGCAVVYAAGGQPLAVILPADNMAAQLTQPAQAGSGIVQDGRCFQDHGPRIVLMTPAANLESRNPQIWNPKNINKYLKLL